MYIVHSLRNVPLSKWPTDLRHPWSLLELLNKNACQIHRLTHSKDTPHDMLSFSSLLSSSLSMLDLDLVWLKTEEECGIELVVAVFQPIRPEGERIPLTTLLIRYGLWTFLPLHLYFECKITNPAISEIGCLGQLHSIISLYLLLQGYSHGTQGPQSSCRLRWCRFQYRVRHLLKN